MSPQSSQSQSSSSSDEGDGGRDDRRKEPPLVDDDGGTRLRRQRETTSAASLSTEKRNEDDVDRSGDNADRSSRAPSSPSSSIRDVVGTGTVHLSDAINDHLIAARYGTAAAIGLLAAYGVSRSPLCFRYRTAADVPSQSFRNRKSLKCRLVRTKEQVPTTASSTFPSPWTSIQQQQQQLQQQQPPPHVEGVPIRCLARHLSPIERILPRSWQDWFLRSHPSARARGFGTKQEKRLLRLDECDDELLEIELAGIRTPPDYFSYEEEPGEWFRKLVNERRPVVTCQLLARRAEVGSNGGNGNDDDSNNISAIARRATISGGRTKKRKIPGLDDGNRNNSRDSERGGNNGNDSAANATAYGPNRHHQLLRNQVAICKLYYRPNPFQLFSTDLAESMVMSGRAAVASDDGGLYAHSLEDGTDKKKVKERIVDATPSVDALRDDAAYLTRLGQAEYRAAAEKRGMWSDLNVRETRRDVVEEAEFQANATVWQKLWRRVVKGG